MLTPQEIEGIKAELRRRQALLASRLAAIDEKAERRMVKTLHAAEPPAEKPPKKPRRAKGARPAGGLDSPAAQQAIAFLKELR